MYLSATLIAYFHLCHRKLWLHANGIQMEHTSQTVAEGKWIDETTYARRSQKWKSLNLGNAKIDHFDVATNTVREVKKSPKLEFVHIAQVKYYLYLLAQKGVQNVRGIIEYPKQKKTTPVALLPEDYSIIAEWEQQALQIINAPTCPKLVSKSYCRTCAFRDFCYV